MPCGAGQGFVGTAWQAASVRTAYRCRAYPDAAQQAVLNRTFGCVRVVWNCILAARQERYATQRTGTSYGQASAALTAMKKDPQRAWLNEVSCVPLQQALRHQQQAFAAFFARRARYPRFKSRQGRQAAEYTRSAFTLRDGALRLAKTPGPLAFVWSWPGIDAAGLDPATVFVSKEPDGRWYVTLAVDAEPPQPLPAAGRAVGVDLGVHDFAVTSDGDRVANPRHLQRKARNLARYQRRLARCQRRLGQPGQGQGQGRAGPPEGPQRPPRLPAQDHHPPGPRQRPDRDRRPRGHQHGPQPAPGPGDQRLRLGRVPAPAAVQVPASRPPPDRDRPLVPEHEDVLGLRVLARRASSEGPDVAMPVLPHPPRPGPQRGQEHPCGRSCRSPELPGRCLRS